MVSNGDDSSLALESKRRIGGTPKKLFLFSEIITILLARI
jgi:hypothetical protein